MTSPQPNLSHWHMPDSVCVPCYKRKSFRCLLSSLSMQQFASLAAAFCFICTCHRFVVVHRAASDPPVGQQFTSRNHQKESVCLPTLTEGKKVKSLVPSQKLIPHSQHFSPVMPQGATPWGGCVLVTTLCLLFLPDLKKIGLQLWKNTVCCRINMSQVYSIWSYCQLQVSLAEHED